MHCHLEVIMPPTAKVEAAIEQILKPFDEKNDNQKYTFWDWYQIGGRYAGSKAQSHFSKDKLDAFQEWLKQEKITVSGIQCGKQELSPASQIPKVDAKWREMFGVTGPCTLFQHANGNKGPLLGDICGLEHALDASAYRVIIAGPRHDKGIEASFMVAQTEWNGVTYIDTSWSGVLRSAISMFENKLEGYTEGYKETHTPKNDWLTVTVDYHS